MCVGGRRPVAHGRVYAASNDGALRTFDAVTGELLELVAAQMTVVAFEDGVTQQPKPSVVQRIAAVRGALASLDPGD